MLKTDKLIMFGVGTVVAIVLVLLAFSSGAIQVGGDESDMSNLVDALLCDEGFRDACERHYDALRNIP